MNRRLLLMLVACALVFGAVFGFKWYGNRMMNQAFDNLPVPPATISTTKAFEDTWPLTLAAVGTLRAVRGTDVTTEASGIVDSIEFESGDSVDAGRRARHARSGDGFCGAGGARGAGCSGGAGALARAESHHQRGDLEGGGRSARRRGARGARQRGRTAREDCAEGDSGAVRRCARHPPDRSRAVHRGWDGHRDAPVARSDLSPISSCRSSCLPTCASTYPCRSTSRHSSTASSAAE